MDQIFILDVATSSAEDGQYVGVAVLLQLGDMEPDMFRMLAVSETGGLKTLTGMDTMMVKMH